MRLHTRSVGEVVKEITENLGIKADISFNECREESSSQAGFLHLKEASVKRLVASVSHTLGKALEKENLAGEGQGGGAICSGRESG